VGRLPKKVNLVDESIDITHRLIGAVIFHELAHSLRDDYNDHGYTWKDCVSLDAAHALGNAQSFTFLAIWALMANWGFTLQRLVENGRIDKPFRDWAEKIAQDGLLKYKDITKRMLRAEKFSA
jgi:hypothetical protein